MGDNQKRMVIKERINKKSMIHFHSRYNMIKHYQQLSNN